jgi:hypothetical protein
MLDDWILKFWVPRVWAEHDRPDLVMKCRRPKAATTTRICGLCAAPSRILMAPHTPGLRPVTAAERAWFTPVAPDKGPSGTKPPNPHKENELEGRSHSSDHVEEKQKAPVSKAEKGSPRRRV